VRGWRWARRRPLAAAVALIVLASLLVAGSVSQRLQERDARPAAPAPRIGELPEPNTVNSTTRRNRDGSYTTAVYGAPVNYRATDGTMRRIDTGLHPTHEDGYAWRSGANAYEMRFKAAGADFAELRFGGQVVRLHADGTQLAGPARVDGSQITYPGAYQGADLRYQIGPSGTRKIIDLAGADSPTSYTFRLTPADGHPLSVQRSGDGSYQVRVGPGQQFVLDAPVVWEGDDTMPAAAARPSLAVRQQGAALAVTLSLDRSWLRAPDRRFPVHLDPSITIQPTVEDATFTTVSTATPLTRDAIFVGSDSTAIFRGALQFDLGSIPAGARVTAATLGLYRSACLATNNPCGNSPQLGVHRMTSPWTTSSTSGQLTFDTTPTSSYTLLADPPQGWMSWPVTSVVSGWVNRTFPNYGLLVKFQSEALNRGGAAAVGHRDVLSGSAKWPKIDVTYALDVPSLQPPATLHADGAELSWTPSENGTGGHEVHRSRTATFTPDATTLIATIGDRVVRSYRDTTAAPGSTFTYRIKDVSTGAVSAPRTVTTPAQGLTTKVLQPGPSVDAPHTCSATQARAAPTSEPRRRPR
jgi:hypothetical protein